MNQFFKCKHYVILIGYCLLAMRLHAQDIELYRQWNGKIDFTAIGNTLNLMENGEASSCSIDSVTSGVLNLSNQQRVEAAFLYWAGSGSGDFEITLNSAPITASREFYYELDSERQFFAAFQDITTTVQTIGNGTYTVGNLDNIELTSAYCETGTNFAGWAILVIYSDPNLPKNQLNLYDGLQSVPDNITIQLNNLNVIDNSNAKIGFLAWEGDSAIQVNEVLSINGTVLSNPPLNPANNAFNGTNSFNATNDLFNMDIDVYPIENTIAIGDQNATIQLTSGQDLVMVNSVITVLNNQLPDASVEINNIITNCSKQEISVNYTVYNSNSSAILPASTQLSFYINSIEVGQEFTSTPIEINGQIINTFNFESSSFIDDNATLSIVVDPNEIINELDETNNFDDNPLNLNLKKCPPLIPQGFSPNQDGYNDWFEIEGLYDIFHTHELLIYNRYGHLVFKGNNDTKWFGESNQNHSSSERLPVGTYFYVLDLNHPNYMPITGWVYLNY